MNTKFNPGGNCRGWLAVVGASLLMFIAWRSPAQTTLIINSNNANFAQLQTDISIGGNIWLNFNGSITVTSPLGIAANTTLFSTGTNPVTLVGGGSNRLFQVPPGVTLILSNLTLSGGNHVGAAGVNGGNGGTKAGGSEGQDGGSGTNGGNGFGGGVFNQGTTIAYTCLFLTNNATGGAGGTGGTAGSGTDSVGNGGSGGGGGAAQGGGIFNMGTLVLSNCTFSGNGTISGSGGVGGTGGSNSFLSGFPGNGGAGGFAQGAGVYNSNHCSLTVVGCTFEFNFCAAGNSQAAGPPKTKQNGNDGSAGGAGQGGGICNEGTNVIINSTFFDNLAVGGNGGNGGNGPNGANGGNGGDGGEGSGGGFYNDASALAAITNCTFAGGESFGGTNGAGGTGAANSGNPGAFGSSLGANIANSGTLLFKNSILAYPTNAANVSGAITDQNNNISSDASANFTQTNSYNNVDPLLGPLTSNGGPTQTMAIETSSLAIDKIFDGSAPPTDQRGVARPVGPRPDIGAYEAGVSLFTVSGTVTFNGVGLSNIIMDASGEAETLTSSNGTFTLSELTAGSYVITPESANFTFSPASTNVTVPANVSNLVFTATVATASTFSISGNIVLGTNGSAYKNVSVKIVSGSTNMTATTGTNGAYSVTNLATGSYTVTPQPTGFFNPTNSVITLSSNTTANFIGLTQTNSTVTVHATNSSAQLSVTLSGVPNVVYRIQASTNLITWTNLESITNGSTGTLNFTVTTSTNGNRFFRAVTP